MKEFDKAKRMYKSIQPPKELNTIVEEAIKLQNNTKKKYWYWPKRLGLATAACLMVFMISLNVSSVLAQAASNIPIIGTIAKVLTVRSYEEENEDVKVTVEIPKIEVTVDPTDETSESDVATNFTEQINGEIEERINVHVEESKKRIEEYKDAFIATGGTEEGFAEKNIESVVDYEIKHESGPIVSFVITSYETWSSAYAEYFYYNLDLKENKELTLADFFGSTYVEIINESIQEQMKLRMEADETISYFSPDMGGFTSIQENQNFYINEDGNPVIVFQKYEIAPGFMGMQEFIIPKVVE